MDTGEKRLKTSQKYPGDAWCRDDYVLSADSAPFPPASSSGGRFPGFLPPRPTDSVDGQLLSELQRLTGEDDAGGEQAVYPEMEREESRLSTYHNWPTGAAVRPEVLARAGFFYTGHGDNVKCFHCDGGLRNWEPGDDPWQEHAKWFPRCGFLVQLKGREYVRRIQQSHSSTGGMVRGPQMPSSPRSADSGHAGGAGGQQSAQAEQLQQLQQQHTCKVCMDKPVSLVFLPCGHLVVCADCAANLTTCPVCRAVIRGSVRAFMS